ncbi:calcium-binding protein [Mesorhizobium sp. LHD-90]|uniref:calcium-binding protein n=1 Tax=Mesorhizobium sp. LHD-90 TaxID=3071414 RepID=UPI0027E18A28|nr:calcium-binding protein [Mesorhizobium sp. LHD-90]MDQ6435580.1 calcium-binding protein [Mesorhizobium sp. LHD-90]
MVLAVQHASADSIPSGYGWSAFSPLEQIDHAAEIGGSSLIHATTTGFVWGASTQGSPGQFTLRPLSLVFEGAGLTYGGGLPNGGTITSMLVVLEGVVFGGSYPPSGPLVLEISGLSINAATNGSLIQQTLAGNIAPLTTYFNGLSWTYNGAGGADRFDGGSKADSLRGYGGDDLLTGGGANDNLYGGDGNDTLQGGAGGDYLSGGTGFDFADYSAAPFVEYSWLHASLQDPSVNSSDAKGDTYNSIEGLIGSKNNDVLYGNSGANVLIGGEGRDVLYGGAGNDRLEAGDGTSELYGEAGNDELRGGAGHDFMVGGAGADKLIGAGGDDDAVYDGATTAIIASLADPTINTGDAAGDTYFGIVGLVGSTHDDELFGDNNDNYLFGSEGNDILHGGTGKDRLEGVRGDDTLYGGEGNDSLDGYYGNDVLDGGAGDDVISDQVSFAYGETNTLIGGAGNDRLTSADGRDTLSGGDGVDDLSSGYSDDILSGGAGADKLNGGSGEDTASYADAAARVVVSFANVANNTGDALGDTFVSIEHLLGSVAGDSLSGNSLQNSIDGGRGNDTLRGYGGNDKLTGGAGADSFVFSSSPNSATNTDTITDFNVADDTVRLDARIFAAAGAPGTLAANAFHIGAAPTTADHRIIYNDVTGALSYDADGAGGNGAVKFATLSIGLALTNADFIVF